MRLLRQILPDTTSQHFSPGMNADIDMDSSKNIRLCLAFRGEEPCCGGCEDDDYKADEDAPAKDQKAISKISVSVRTRMIVVFSTRLPFSLIYDDSAGSLSCC